MADPRSFAAIVRVFPMVGQTGSFPRLFPLMLSVSNPIVMRRSLDKFCLEKGQSRNGCFLILLSTDLVFDGMRGNYREEDDPHPISVYGWTKLAAELAVRNVKSPCAIIRTSLVYGRSPGGDRGADERLVASWKGGKRTLLFVDEYRNPTAVGELAQVITEIVHRRVTGIWHVAGAECVSRFELGARVASVLGYSESMLIPRTIDEGDCTPPRARNSTLNIDKIRRLLDFPFAAIVTNLRHEYGQ